VSRDHTEHAIVPRAAPARAKLEVDPRVTE
jgi:hypothetical protein